MRTASPLIAVCGWEIARLPPAWAAPQLEMIEALAGACPEVSLSLWVPGDIPGRRPTVDVRSLTATPSEMGRLWFEQIAFPRRAAAAGARWLWVPYAAAPLSSRLPVFTEETPASSPVGIGGRLRRSAGLAGLGGACVFFSQGPAPSGPAAARLEAVLPWLPADYTPETAPEDAARRACFGLEQGYVLAAAAEEHDLHRLLAAWTWVEGSVSDGHPLVLMAEDSTIARRCMHAAIARAMVTPKLLDLALLHPGDVPALLRGASVLLDAGQACPASLLVQALGCGLVIAGEQMPRTQALIGEAGFLVPAGDARSLGAACLSLLTDEALVQDLRERAAARTSAWRGDAPLRARVAAMRLAAGGSV